MPNMLTPLALPGGRRALGLRQPSRSRGSGRRGLNAEVAEGASVSDDASLMQALGHRVVTVAGDPRNVHVTTPAELELIGRILETDRRLP